MTVRHRGLTVDWLGYATLRVEGTETVVYLDPGRYGVLDGTWEPHREGLAHPPAIDYRAGDGDVVCVTHVHHYDSDAIRRVASDDATVVLFEGIDVHDTDRDVERPAELPYDVRTVSEEDELMVGDVPVWTVPAYNDPDAAEPNYAPDGRLVHPKGIGCGFLFAVDGTRVFYPGDSDVLPGHAELDVSLLVPSISKHYTMDRREAAELAEAMDPDLVLPMHYNTFEALEGDSAAFAADVAAREVPVVLDER